MTVLRLPRKDGSVPLIREVEGLLGSSEIAATSALDKKKDTIPPWREPAKRICAILFRLDPPAMDLVHTKLPRVKVLGRESGKTKLRVGEEIALRILDPEAIKLMNY